MTTLPITFRNVPHSVAGSSKYQGDLILTPELIYYFPHTDVATKRFLIIAIVLLIVLAPLLVAISIYLLYVFVFLFVLLLAAVGLSIPGLIVEMLSSGIKKAWELHKEFQERPRHTPEPHDEQPHLETVDLSPHINLYPIILYPALWYPLILDSALWALKENKSLSPYSLPTPTRFSKRDIHRITLSFAGLLSIKIEYDMEHKFHLGMLRKNMLKKGLIEGAFIS